MFFGSEISPCPQSKPSCRATGPFSQQYGVQACVETSVRRKSPAFSASAKASRSGMNSGGHPAITPLTATWRTVTSRCIGGIAPREWPGGRSVNVRIGLLGTVPINDKTQLTTRPEIDDSTPRHQLLRRVDARLIVAQH